jgi:hypothetical protein
VQGDVIGLIALNFVLGVVLAGVMSITFVIQIFGVHFHNLAADPASLRVPDYAIADLESLFHCSLAVPFGDWPEVLTKASAWADNVGLQRQLIVLADAGP